MRVSCSDTVEHTAIIKKKQEETTMHKLNNSTLGLDPGRVKGETDRKKGERECEETEEMKGDKEQDYSNRKETGGRSGRTVIYIYSFHRCSA